jgi:predicted TIM-barrel fold metal-dependent hydrolase
MINVFPMHPRTRFDLYHMGMPSVRQTGVIGKNNPNVWLNLCWSHVISPKMTRSFLNEWMDLVPMNKIIGFGGDYGPESLEKIYGHLQMAKEDAAEALAERVAARRMSERQAREVAQAWFYDNPRELYRIEPQG